MGRREIRSLPKACKAWTSNHRLESRGDSGIHGARCCSVGESGMSGASYFGRSGFPRTSRCQPRNAYANSFPRRGNRLGDRWRERLPDPTTYYRSRLAKIGIPNPGGWAACCCPLHEDRHASASVNLQTGGFRCHGCGARGDLVAFHMQWTGLDFTAAVRDLTEDWS